MKAIKGLGDNPVRSGDVLVLIGGGPIGKLQDGDMIEIEVDRRRLTGHIDFVGTENQVLLPIEAAELLAKRPSHPHLRPHPALPDDTRLWAALQRASGGVWAGCVYDVDKIIKVIDAGLSALARESLHTTHDCDE